MIDSRIDGVQFQYESGPTICSTLSSSQNCESAKNAAGNMQITIIGNDTQYMIEYVFHIGYCGCILPVILSLPILP